MAQNRCLTKPSMFERCEDRTLSSSEAKMSLELLKKLAFWLHTQIPTNCWRTGGSRKLNYWRRFLSLVKCAWQNEKAWKSLSVKRLIEDVRVAGATGQLLAQARRIRNYAIVVKVSSRIRSA